MKITKNLKKLALLLLLATSSFPAFCGTLTGTINSILFNKDIPNTVFIQINATSTGTPACATANFRMVFDVTTPVGKALLANLIAVKLSNPSAVITLVGKNACTLWSDTEDFSYTFL